MNIFKKILPHLIPILIFVLISVIYFMPQLKGKVVTQSDIKQNLAMVKESSDHQKEVGEPTLWVNSMFMGMPIYQINFPAYGNYIHKHIEPALSLFIKGPIGRFLAMSICFYILLIILGANRWLATIGAFAFAFSSNHVILYDAGHNTKLVASTFFAIIFGGLYLLYEKQKWLIGFVLLVVGMSFNISANHYQMSFYFGLTIIIFIIITLIRVIKEKQNLMKKFLYPSIVALFAVLLAVGPSFSSLWTTYEYSKETIRGNPILEKEIIDESVEMNNSQVNGLGWDYAMQWSNGFEDVIAMAIPSAAGGGSGELIGRGNDNYNELQRYGLKSNRKDKKISAPLYWGKLPFTVGPTYFGISLIFFFILGLFLIKGNIKYWIGISVLFTILLSLGKNFETLQRILFDYVPFYNKFRAPNSVASITEFFFPLLAVLVLSKVIIGGINKEELWNGLKKTVIIVGGFTLLMLVMGSSILDFTSDADARYNNPDFVDLLMDTRKSLFLKDAFRSLLIVLLAAALTWALIKNKLKQNVFLILLGALVLFDVIGVSKRYLDYNSFKREKKESTQFAMRPVDQQILSLEKERGAYRVLDMSVNTYNSANTSYFHNTVGGYHPAKLQRIQDVIEKYLSGQLNPEVLHMLNTKYLISQKGELQTNNLALGNAWFVDSIVKVNTPNEEIDKLGDIKTSKTAIVLDAEFDNYIGDFDPKKEGDIKMVKYAPDRIIYESNSPSEQLALFSEAWYGPNKGWYVKIDNKEAKHIRANYMLRALRIPKGKHKIEFYFHPKNYFMGERISKISSFIIMGLILLTIVFWAKSILNNKTEGSEVIEEKQD